MSTAIQALSAAQQQAVLDGDVVQLPTGLIQPSKSNASRSARMKPAWLQDLASNIKKVGLLQAIIVRPIDAPAGRPQFEIVAGENRWRANVIAELPMIRTVIKDLTDIEAQELQLFENLHRQTLHPLEEAEGYEALLIDPPGRPARAQGYTVEQLAAKFDMSSSYIYGRLQLCRLVPAARKAFYDGELTASNALLVATVPQESQLECLKRVKQGWGGEPMSHKQASEFVQENYRLVLSKAPFKITDATLLADVGSCKDCPKRTGANPDLFTEKGPDRCTEPKCFTLKKEAHQARVVAEAKEKGLEVIKGKEAKQVMPDRHSELKGYMRLDKVDYRIDPNKPLSKVLGKDAPATVLFEDPHTHDLIEVVKTDAAMKVLKDKGVVTGGRLTSMSPTQAAEEKKRKADMFWRFDTALDLMQKVVSMGGFDEVEVCTFLRVEMAVFMWNRMGSDDTKRAEKLLAWAPLGYSAGGSADEERLRALPAAELDKAILAMMFAGETTVATYNANPPAPERILRVAKVLGFDPEAMKRERLQEIKEALTPAAKKATKAPAKKAPAKAAKKAPAKAPASSLEAAISITSAAIAKTSTATSKGPNSLSPQSAWPFPDPDKPKGKAAAAPAAETKPTADPVKPLNDPAWPFPLSTPGANADHWRGQHLKLKDSKSVGELRDVVDGVFEIAVPRKGFEGEFNLHHLAKHEFIVLPGQVRPTHASGAHK